MAVRTAPRRNSRPEVDTEVEEKAEPRVTVNKQLAKLITDWDLADRKAESYWPKIVQFVIDNETTRAELKEALKTIRGMKEITANNEVSVIMRVADNDNGEVQQCIDGEYEGGVTALRELGKKKQEGSDDAEAKFDKAIARVAKYAIEEVELELADFVASAKQAYKDQYAKVQAKANRDEEKENEQEDETEEEE